MPQLMQNCPKSAEQKKNGCATFTCNHTFICTWWCSKTVIHWVWGQQLIWTLDRNVSPDLWLIICWCFTPAYYYLWHCRIVSRVKCRCSWRLYSCTRRWGVWNDRKCDTDCGVVWLPLLYEAEVEILNKFCFYIL